MSPLLISDLRRRASCWRPIPDSALIQGESKSQTLSSLTESLSSITHMKTLPFTQPIFLLACGLFPSAQTAWSAYLSQSARLHTPGHEKRWGHCDPISFS